MESSGGWHMTDKEIMREYNIKPEMFDTLMNDIKNANNALYDLQHDDEDVKDINDEKVSSKHKCLIDTITSSKLFSRIKQFLEKFITRYPDLSRIVISGGFYLVSVFTKRYLTLLDDTTLRDVKEAMRTLNISYNRLMTA